MRIRGAHSGVAAMSPGLITSVAITLLGPSYARATEPSALSDVVVTATRVAAPAFDVPATIFSVPGTRFIEDSLGVNFADGAQSVPGLLARNQYNYAQDQQISIRGIGADSAFGVRGVRIYQDGIPQSGPDGQGQISQFNLASASRVEVLEGPFSALYGNSSGGVIQLFTAPGRSPGGVRGTLAHGSYGAVRAGVDAGDAIGALDYHLDFTHFSWRGFRPHQSARSESFNGKVDYSVGPRDRLTVVANVLSRPGANDPQGLTAAQFATDPNQTSTAALEFNTRKALEQQEGGLIYEHALGAHRTLRVMGYYGHRSVLQFLSIPVGAQKPVTSSGGVVDLHRDFGGGDARWTWQGPFAGRPASWVAGVSYDTQNERRRGYDNFVGPTLGVQGALRRDENDIARNLDEYTQASLALTPRWTMTAGLRHSDVRFTTQDHFFAGSNGSGAATYAATTPVVGVLYAARRWLHLYASWGQGFRTPLASELAYRPDGLPGLNLALRPSRSNAGEIGVKIRPNRDLSAELSGFDTRTSDEIVVLTNAGGRSTYENAGRTRRSGVQASLDDRFSPAWGLRLAYTYVDTVVIDAYDTCAAAPCLHPTVAVAAGSRLPGVARNDAYATLHWGRGLGWYASVSGQYLGAIAADSTNRAFARAYPVFNLSGGYRRSLGAEQLAVFLRLDNLLDRRYVGAVIVNQANGAFFEPAPGFNVLAGVSLRLR